MLGKTTAWPKSVIVSGAMPWLQSDRIWVSRKELGLAGWGRRAVQAPYSRGCRNTMALSGARQNELEVESEPPRVYRRPAGLNGRPDADGFGPATVRQAGTALESGAFLAVPYQLELRFNRRRTAKITRPARTKTPAIPAPIHQMSCVEGAGIWAVTNRLSVPEVAFTISRVLIS